MREQIGDAPIIHPAAFIAVPNACFVPSYSGTITPAFTAAALHVRRMYVVETSLRKQRKSPRGFDDVHRAARWRDLQPRGCGGMDSDSTTPSLSLRHLGSLREAPRSNPHEISKPHDSYGPRTNPDPAPEVVDEERVEMAMKWSKPCQIAAGR